MRKVDLSVFIILLTQNFWTVVYIMYNYLLILYIY